MKLKIIATVMFVFFFSLCSSKSQEEGTNTEPISVEELKDRVDGIDENVTVLLGDVAGLKKLKISGYMQINFEKTEFSKGFNLSGKDFTNNPYDSAFEFTQSRFRVRRARLKFSYDAGITQFVLQGDFSNEKFSLKDAYINISDPWTKYFTLTTGVFNRPNYEIEYSSSQRESMERSKVIRTLYPDERDLGAMLTINPEEMFKLQVAGFNNTYQGAFKQFYPNNDTEPIYYMARLTKEFLFPNQGLGIDLGVHARLGSVSANKNKVIESENNNTMVDSTSIKVGDLIPRTWFGIEAQLYYDFLGGMKILGEYIMGTNVDEPTLDNKDNPIPANLRKRDFSGYYIMLVKNIFTEWQFAIKYDNYNPNTQIEEKNINDTKDLPLSTLGIGINNYSFDNIRISLWYDINKTTTSNNLIGAKKLLANDPVDNLLTLRFQFKF